MSDGPGIKKARRAARDRRVGRGRVIDRKNFDAAGLFRLWSYAFADLARSMQNAGDSFRRLAAAAEGMKDLPRDPDMTLVPVAGEEA